MWRFKNFSISTQLNIVAAAAGGVALAVATLMFAINDISFFRSSKVDELTTVADVIGSNAIGMLTFDDRVAASELLSSLRRQPAIEFACLYDSAGKVFASYRHGLDDAFTPPKPQGKGYLFTESGHLDVYHPILLDGEKLGTIYVHANMDELRSQLVDYVRIVAAVLIVALVAAWLLTSRLQRFISEPVVQLAETAQQISTEGDYSIRVKKGSNNEMGRLYEAFNRMLAQIQRGGRQLQQAHNQLETRVNERTHQLSEANLELSREIHVREKAESELESLHRQLLDAARRAGMAEIANGVLHNVGNVLNSVNVSATVVEEQLRKSKVSDLNRAVALLQEHEHDLGRFITESEQGRKLPRFLEMLAGYLNAERDRLLDEIRGLSKNIEHIKTIVAMQQSYAGVSGVVEPVQLATLVDDALKMNAPTFGKYRIDVVRDYEDLPEMGLEKQRLLQILINLIRNAKHALVDSDHTDRCLTLKIGTNGERRVRIEVADNGVGIPNENLTKIFSHGFTTKKQGRGFGLHSCAIAAKEMGGALTAQSDGPGSGATFVLELPYKLAEVAV